MATDKEHHRHDRRFSGDMSRLRAADRLERMELFRVVNIVSSFVPTGSVLDVGSGSGVFAEEFARRGFEAMGIDVNASMVRYASTLVPTAEFRLGSAESLPFSDRTYDIVFLGHVLHETDDPQKALWEARRVSKQMVAVLEWPYLEEEHGPPLEHRIPSERIENLGRSAGFREIIREPLTHMVFYRMS